MSNYTSFEELDCWKKCRDVRIWVENFICERVDSNDFDMINNLRRATRSSTRNVAEGFGRFHFKENMQFCRISRGSLFEVKDDLLTFLDEKKALKSEISDGLKLVNQAIRSLNGYINYLKRFSNN